MEDKEMANSCLQSNIIANNICEVDNIAENVLKL